MIIEEWQKVEDQEEEDLPPHEVVSVVHHIVQHQHLDLSFITIYLQEKKYHLHHHLY